MVALTAKAVTTIAKMAVTTATGDPPRARLSNALRVGVVQAPISLTAARLGQPELPQSAAVIPVTARAWIGTGTASAVNDRGSEQVS